MKKARVEDGSAAKALACGASLILFAAMRPAPLMRWARRRSLLIRSALLPCQRTAILRPIRSRSRATTYSSATATAALPTVPAAR